MKYRCKYCRTKKELTELSSRVPQVCKEPSCITKFYEDYKEKIHAKAKKNQKKESAEKTKKEKESLKTRREKLNEAQKVFNAFIRERDKGKPCHMCRKPIKGVVHACHYLSQGNHSLVRFHEDNVWSGCYSCNVSLSGNLIEFRKTLLEVIGEERLNWLEENGRKEKKWTDEEIKEIISTYKNKTLTLQ